ncbi:restriction endonuclease [Asanoa iriomotensis]|nr:restriction endonuclease [Asanoa iriomotensis]
MLAYLLESVPGCYVQRNTLNYFGTEEVDITVANEKADGGLRMLPGIFLVECKNWSQPVDSTTLGYFVNVVVDRGCSLGILAAANGITGHQEHRSRAYAIGAAALVRGIRILVITRDDLLGLGNPNDLVSLLHKRNLSLTAHGSIHLG